MINNEKLMTYDEIQEAVARDYNNKEGTLEGYNCSKCKNRGWFKYYVDGNMIAVKCDCMAIRFPNKKS